MSHLTPYLALAIFPVAFLAGFSFNLPELFWGARLAREEDRVHSKEDAGEGDVAKREGSLLTP